MSEGKLRKSASILSMLSRSHVVKVSESTEAEQGDLTSSLASAVSLGRESCRRRSCEPTILPLTRAEVIWCRRLSSTLPLSKEGPSQVVAGSKVCAEFPRRRPL